MKASAIANVNIALIKYWGKRDKELMLPNNGSISMTADKLFTHTTVDFSNQYEEDQFTLNDKVVKNNTNEYNEYIGRFLNIIRSIFGIKENVKIVSYNNFPTSAGLASSASGFAALTTAINESLNLGLNLKQLSMVARRGSGSASRSIFGGFVEWRRGQNKDGSDSYAEQIVDDKFWPQFKMIFCLTNQHEKKIKSRVGMMQTVKTSPMYKVWLDTVDDDLNLVRNAILKKDFTTVGSVAESNCLKMHATMLTTKPEIVYWNAGTMNIIHKVLDLRESGVECYFTIDAGPQVKVMCLDKDMDVISKELSKIEGVENIITSKLGTDARIINKHLF